MLPKPPRGVKRVWLTHRGTGSRTVGAGSISIALLAAVKIAVQRLGNGIGTRKYRPPVVPGRRGTANALQLSDDRGRINARPESKRDQSPNGLRMRRHAPAPFSHLQEDLT